MLTVGVCACVAAMLGLTFVDMLRRLCSLKANEGDTQDGFSLDTPAASVGIL